MRVSLFFIVLVQILMTGIAAANPISDTTVPGFVWRPEFSDIEDENISQAEQIYNRPFVAGVRTQLQTQTAVGGYIEANTNYFIEGGISDGFSFEMRRFNIFLYSNISQRIKFLAELEFEHGVEEIALETALVDVVIFPGLNLRGGILLPPIGHYNQNHDSPKWEFIERPLVSTGIIPTTLSEVGAGVFGDFSFGNLSLTYDAYAVNGLQDGIILNDEGRTSLQAGKSEERFAEDNNGIPMFTGRFAVGYADLAEIGLSYYGLTPYNTYRIEGELVETPRL